MSLAVQPDVRLPLALVTHALAPMVNAAESAPGELPFRVEAATIATEVSRSLSRKATPPREQTVSLDRDSALDRQIGDSETLGPLVPIGIHHPEVRLDNSG